jgi:hypothetical protein
MHVGHLPEDTQLIYANWVRMTGTPFELSIDFGYNEVQGPPKKFPVRVAMSWEHAKALAELLQSNIVDYEQSVGPIREVFETGQDASD